MIPYELAKQLKDAGFPQTGRGGYLSMSNGLVGWSQANLNHGISQPTLEEFIEGCGDDLLFVNRSLSLKKWYAKKSGFLWGEGSTLIEAVARLWLALHATGDATA
jgi:hypothetical protein